MNRLTAFIAFSLFIPMAASAQPAIEVNFDGAYTNGVFDTWQTGTDGWGDPPDPRETTPGHGGAGSAQALVVSNGTHYVYSTLTGLTTGKEYQVSVWVRSYFANGTTGDPGGNSWIEFGWDPDAQNDPAQVDLWNVAPKFDFAANMGNWVQYTGEQFTAAGDSVTIAFKVGSVDSTNGIRGEFDDLQISEVIQPIQTYQFPDDFNGTYTLGIAHGWRDRFIPGGVSPRWEEGVGRTGSAQRLRAATAGENLAVNIGVTKRFEVEADRVYRIGLWVMASDTSGTALANVDQSDPGPIVKFGVDTTAQITSPTAASILWSTAPTDHFSVASNVGQWGQFNSPPFRTTTDTISVWLWAQGDYIVGVDAKFDDLTSESLTTESRQWQLYR